MKEKNRVQGRATQNSDHERDSDRQNPSTKNKKQGQKVHTDKFSDNWESDEAVESYNKGKAYAHDGRRNR